MSFHVFSNTGHVFYPEEGVAIHPSEPTKVDELSEAMTAQAVNLRIVEVDDSGQPVSVPEVEPVDAGAVDPQEFASTVRERDQLAQKLDDLTKESSEAEADLTDERDKALADLAAANGVVASLTTERDQARADLAASAGQVEELTTNVGTLRATVASLTTERDQAVANAAVAPGTTDEQLTKAIDLVLSASPTSLGRLPNEALQHLCLIRGISPVPDTTEALVAALKPAA